MIHYLIGDATNPQLEEPRVIAHICNDAGGWGKGFVVGLGARYPIAEREYRYWAKHDGAMHGRPFELGRVGFVLGRPGTLFKPHPIWIANMIAQHGYRKTYSNDGVRYVDYFNLGLCLETVQTFASSEGASVHMPRIGCGLGGGDWNVIEEMIERYLCQRGVEVYVYDWD